MAGHSERTESVRSRRESAQPLDFSTAKAIGHFELIRELARGGMGQVFLGRDTKLGRKVAIKFLLRDDAHFVQRFLVEARATARCTHENIVTIFEVGEHDGLPYMVLEYLEGKTLSAVLEGKPSPRQFCELMVPVLRALERAHEHGIVHRDLKPSNIFVTDRGGVKVLDFGVARMTDRAEHELARATAMVEATLVDASPVMTDASALIGTLPYMSPEQWGAGPVDHQSDLWALGVIFWRGLTGKHPAGTLSPEKLRARVRDLDTPLPSIAGWAPTLPAPLVAVIDRLLRKQTHERYRSASEVLADLQAFLAPRALTSGELSPYRGLDAFGEDDARFFFGRDNEIRSALGQLDAWPLLGVVGPSGVGKSSFVHAGLVPALKAQSGGSWQVHVLRPGRTPLHRLAAVLEEAPGQGTHLMQQLVEAPGLFGAMLRDTAIRRGMRVVVVVDQLEELFTLCDNDDIRRLFLAALLAAADDTTSPVRVVLSMRADFLDRLAGHPQFLAELSRGLLFLAAPDRDSLRDAVERPAELAGYAFETPAIVDDMLQVATSRGALPLLSFAAMRQWDARDRSRKLLTSAAYQQMGGVGGAFARHADQVAAALPPASQPLLRAIILRLVTPEGTRAVVDQKELLTLAGDPREVERVVDHLVRARLVHLHTDPEHGATVEIVHEMLITEWPTLRRWLDDSSALRAFHHELRAAAKQWQTRGRPGDLVWRGAIARDALRHVGSGVLELSALEQQFVAAIRRRRLRARVALVAAAVVVAAGVAFAFFKITRAEREARANLDSADRARVELADQVKRLEAEQHARATAERERSAAEQQKTAVEQDLAQSKQLSREQLEEANAKLVEQVNQAEAAKQKAQIEEQKARKASADAEAARAQTEKLLGEKQRELDTLKKRKQDIIDVDLTGGSK